MTSGLKQELDGLKRNIDRTDELMSQLASEFWMSGGVCCPGCGVPGYSELELKQERRERRVKEIVAKLKRDGGPSA
ncbi:hypothetical protein AQ938_06660 [Burkholderia pseudomallei]|uniref:hypothetical protein n=1 Tax=Burkholderia pseudomallei TaxID=28450 RepID=UPI00015F7C3F|nr:hypothetical protein [Burkholderia pseudomallei]AJX61008.1 hypothetical protein DP47_3442 [Burkholderia pseudomallei Pasteur 52237]EDO95251.1 hypothetical protein BURPSPAST_M0055 [Burkholderia pseudomallei Pasteur 52237]OND78959.1 hypothetical protein AQ938_06660 [Burkholderia pseudomallei]